MTDVTSGDAPTPHAETEARIAALTATGEDPAAPDTTTTRAPESGTSTQRTDDDAFEAPFNLNDIPDETVRTHVERYARQLQGAFTTKTQELAEQRKQAESAMALERDLRDPEARPDALKWLAENGMLTEEQVAELYGWEITSPNDDELADEDPVAQKLRELEGKMTAREQAEAQAREQADQQAFIAKTDQQIGETITAIEKDIGRDLTENEQGLLVSRALVAYPTAGPDGTPDVRAAYDEYAAVLTDFQKSWVDGKRTAQTTSQDGVAAAESLDLNDERQRVDYIEEQIRNLG